MEFIKNFKELMQTHEFAVECENLEQVEKIKEFARKNIMSLVIETRYDCVDDELSYWISEFMYIPCKSYRKFKDIYNVNEEVKNEISDIKNRISEIETKL